VEVGAFEAQHDELNRSYRHRLSFAARSGVPDSKFTSGVGHRIPDRDRLIALSRSGII
jgi:hypothetical protein